VPEGDTILRTARSLGRWLGGREITAAACQRRKVPAERLVGRRVEAVEARAKHLLVRLSSGDVLHTHMRMTGSWHLYRAGERWRKPGWRARVVLEAGDRVAVCFDAPVVELLGPGEVERHPSIAGLGPDVLVDPLDAAEVCRRAAARPPETPVGDLLLDQRVVSGIGNVYRCEALFLAGLHPSTPRAALGDEALAGLVGAAAALMRANLDPVAGFERRFSPSGGPRGPWVYGRGGRPCHRCRTPIGSSLAGEPPRPAWWCPSCQPVVPPAPHGAPGDP